MAPGRWPITLAAPVPPRPTAPAVDRNAGGLRSGATISKARGIAENASMATASDTVAGRVIVVGLAAPTGVATGAAPPTATGGGIVAAGGGGGGGGATAGAATDPDGGGAVAMPAARP